VRVLSVSRYLQNVIEVHDGGLIGSVTVPLRNGTRNSPPACGT
jgi:hypothetical protein